MKQSQEPKYEIVNGRLVSRKDHEAIPDDEPVFILRARDGLSVSALIAYFEQISMSNRLPHDMHTDAVAGRINDFQRFANEHPARMKYPSK